MSKMSKIIRPTNFFRIFSCSTLNHEQIFSRYLNKDKVDTLVLLHAVLKTDEYRRGKLRLGLLVDIKPIEQSLTVELAYFHEINIMKFCANLSFMFTEQPFLQRYKLAKEAGFKAVETGFPFNLSEQQVLEAKNSANVKQILINTYTGDVTKGEVGFAAIPGKEQEFKDSILKTINYAKTLGASKIHVMAGKVGTVTQAHHTTYEDNLKFAAGLLEKENILGVIEPINKYAVPDYYLNCYERALEVVKKVNSPNLRIMLDIFHLQHIRGNVTNTIRDLINYIGHVQIAQVPNRNEPDTPGELNYVYVLETLKSLGYNDWIGLEYKPLGDTANGLKWVHDFGYNL